MRKTRIPPLYASTCLFGVNGGNFCRILGQNEVSDIRSLCLAGHLIDKLPILRPLFFNTSMHSSRMHTVRNRSHLLEVGGRGSGPRGACLLLGGSGPRGRLVPGGGGVSGPRGGPGPRGVVSQHAVRQTPHVDRHTCKNITFATSLRTVTKESQSSTQSQ